jgi:AraC-like DNA-binding protein
MEAIIVAGSAIAAFTCILLLTKRPLADSDAVAAIFMLLLALPMLEKLLLAGSIALPYLGFSIFSGAPFAFGPFLYLYARSVISPGSSQGPRRFLHFLPFLASVGIALVIGLNRPAVTTSGSTGGALPDPGLMIISMLMVISFLTYTLKIVAMLRAHAKGIPDYFSRDSIAINLRWLGWITLGFFLAYAMAILGELAFAGLGGSQFRDSSILRDAGTLFFALIFGFCAIKQPVIFKVALEQAPEPGLPGIEEAPARKYEKSGLRDDEAAALLARLEERMSSAKPWLDSDLTIEDLALALGVQRHHLTQVINDGLGKNFYRYVNEHRVEEVKRKIASGEAERFSILGVALDSGFNSKSAFNEAFKGIMGCTPSEYRKSVRPSPAALGT